jgi:hypothetical protein
MKKPLLDSFKNFTEDKDKSVVFTFGRFNPPTIGHEKLIRKVVSESSGNDYRIYVSQSSDPERNPLQYKEKVQLMRKMFPKYGRNIIFNKKIINVFNILVDLYDQGYRNVTMVVGSDRVPEFKRLMNQYNGKKARHGFYDFDTISTVSAGDRDPDADDVSGMSASKMRAAAKAGDLDSFSKGLPKSFGDKVGVFNLIRKRMGLKEMVNFRKHIDLGSLSEKREQYIAGEIFNEGDKVVCLRTGTKFTIYERKSTYVTDGQNKYWIRDLIEVKQDKDVKDKKGTQPAKYFAKDAEGDEMSKSTKDKRDAHFKKGAAKSDDDPSAYKKAPGDAGAKTKPSKHTKKFKQMFGEEVKYFNLAGLKKELKKEYGSKASSLKIVKVKGGVSIQTPSGNELERYNHVPKLGYTTEEKNPRIPRKKGQPANSKKHSDLYTDENPKGTIKGLGFKDVETAKASVSKIKSSGKSHAHKIQAAIAMEQRARVMGKKSEAAVYRSFINDMKKKTKAKNEAYEIGTPEYTKHTKKITPGQELDEEQLDEKLITFANKAYPKEGHALILAGGAGSGKGFVLNNLVGLEGKVFDVDALKSLVLKAPKLKQKIKAELGVDLNNVDLKNPKDVGKLHQIVGDILRFPNKAQQAFFTQIITKPALDKPNIIFDVTLKDLRKLDNITRLVQQAGYDKKKIHIVWVVNDIEVAKVQNLDPKRGRVVPVEILVNTHRGASQTMLDIVKMGKGLKKYMDGDIVFAFNKINVDSELKTSKKGGAFIKDAEYFYAKRSGQPPISFSDMGDKVLKKIAGYVPNANTWTLD